MKKHFVNQRTAPGGGAFWPRRRCSLLTDPGRVCASLAPRLGQKSLAANVVVFMKRCTKAQNGARLPGFAIRISVLWVCFGFRVSDFGFWARSRSLCGTILKTRKVIFARALSGCPVRGR